jgi:hypothetical protein
MTEERREEKGKSDGVAILVTNNHLTEHLSFVCRWRAPGSAPVVDACGQAGGKYKETQVGGESFFSTTKFATMGDLGSQILPKGPAMAQWKAGDSVTVSWGIRYNHGVRGCLCFHCLPGHW